MPAIPVHTATPDDITLRHAEALTGIDYKTIHDAAMAGHIRHRRVYGPYSFRVHRPDVLAYTPHPGTTK